MRASKPALDSMTAKLEKYYAATEHTFVYFTVVILQPRRKLTLFKQSKSDEDAEKYPDPCRQQYIEEYECFRDSLNPQVGQKVFTFSN